MANKFFRLNTLEEYYININDVSLLEHYSNLGGGEDLYITFSNGYVLVINYEDVDDCVSDYDRIIKLIEEGVTVVSNNYYDEEETIFFDSDYGYGDSDDYSGSESMYIFLGWATTPDATEPEYQVDDTIEITNNMDLYAVWEVK